MPTPCEILKTSKRVAVLGMSPNPARTSHQIALFLIDAGYEVVPVNPGHGGILGLACFRTLADIPGVIDIVDVFRAAEHETEVAAQVLAMATPPKAVWFQLNAGGWGVEAELRAAGMEVYVDSCIKVVHANCR